MNAAEILQAICEVTTDKRAILGALCDGEALAAVGVTDADQEAVEEVFDTVNKAKDYALKG